jgi:quinol monooxygenase YgiN
VGFIQIIEFKTGKIDEVNAAGDRWLAATEGKRTAAGGVIAEDRDQPGTYVQIIQFPSYEAAMENSELPETQAAAAEMESLTDGTATFRNLDIVREDLI